MIAKIQTQTGITKEIRILETNLDAEEKSNAQAITQRGLTGVQQIYEKHQYCIYPIQSDVFTPNLIFSNKFQQVFIEDSSSMANSAVSDQTPRSAVSDLKLQFA